MLSYRDDIIQIEGHTILLKPGVTSIKSFQNFIDRTIISNCMYCPPGGAIIEIYAAPISIIIYKFPGFTSISGLNNSFASSNPPDILVYEIKCSSIAHTFIQDFPLALTAYIDHHQKRCENGYDYGSHDEELIY